jgi:aminocarboxymuconate-semialdehyde decarboxylase
LRESDRPYRLDIHRHYLPSFLIDDGRNDAAIDGLRVDDGMVIHRQGYQYPLDGEFHDLEAMLASLDAGEVDHAVMSVTPTLYFYNCDAADAVNFCRRTNDWITALAEETGGRISGMANLPMQDLQAAAAELQRCVEELGMRSAQIGTEVEGRPLDDPGYEGFFSVAEKLGAVLLLHPYFVGPRPGFEDFYMTNLVGLPLSTTLAAARLLFSGFFARHGVRFILVHGGGFIPYKLGRLDRGYEVREESSRMSECRPSDSLDLVYYDTLTHDGAALRFLIDLVGADHVLFGTDLPFDMTDPGQAEEIEKLPSDVADRVWGANALELLGKDRAATTP